MATNTSTINVAELDFDNIKQELINYLSSQQEFSEYNFEGSALNVLMDLLAYNTHLTAFQANMVGNEIFLDSAQLRQSVVSKAKEVGYTPRSVRSSMATVNIAVPGVSGTPAFITMKAGIVFDTDYEYQFSTNKEYLLYPSLSVPTTYEVEDVNLYDGHYVEFHYTVNAADDAQQFIIPSVNVDMSTLKVFVQPSKTSSSIQEYTLNDDLNRLKPTSTVFFTDETPEGFYRVTFGDGVLGKKVINGNYITLSYIVAKGKVEANNITRFDPIERIDTYTGYSITVTEPSYGGAEKETIDEIKFLAPKMYQSQKRAVTTQDYETFLYHDYPWIDTMNVWGGEYNDPPVYGKVFFAIKPKHTQILSNKLKEQVKADLISKYNVVTIVPEIIDPDYIYVGVDTDVYYTRSRTVLQESQLVTAVVNTIDQYFADTTEKFKMDFRFSPMTTKIDATDQSFDSSLSNITIHKRVYPITNLRQTFYLKFNNALIPGSVESTTWDTEDTTVPGSLMESIARDNGLGIMQVIHVSTGNILNPNAGTVDYNTGSVSLTVFPYLIPLDTLDIRVYATPVNKNVISGYNQIIIPDDSAVNVDVNRKQGVSVRMNAVTVRRG